MSQQKKSAGSKPPARVISAVKIRAKEMIGTFEILAYTKHGPTSLIGVHPNERLETGDIVKTQVRVLGAKHFIIVGEHKKPMKLSGRWYEVTVIKYNL